MSRTDLTQKQINKSIFSYIKKHKSQIRFLKYRGYTHKDIIQMLTYFVLEAYQSYAPSKGTLSTFFKTTLKNDVLNEIEKIKYYKCKIEQYKEAKELFNELYFHRISINNFIIRKDFYSIFKHLNELETKFLIYRLQYNMTETAEKLKEPRATLYDVQKRIKKKLQNIGFENYFQSNPDTF